MKEYNINLDTDSVETVEDKSKTVNATEMIQETNQETTPETTSETSPEAISEATPAPDSVPATAPMKKSKRKRKNANAQFPVNAELSNHGLQSLGSSNTGIDRIITEFINNGIGATEEDSARIVLATWKTGDMFNLAISDYGKGLARDDFGRLISLGHKDTVGHQKDTEATQLNQFGVGGTFCICSLVSNMGVTYSFTSTTDGKELNQLVISGAVKKNMTGVKVNAFPEVGDNEYEKVVKKYGMPSTMVLLENIDRKYMCSLFGGRKSNPSEKEVRRALVELCAVTYRGLLKSGRVEIIVCSHLIEGRRSNRPISPVQLPFDNTISPARPKYITVGNLKVACHVGRIDENARLNALDGSPLRKEFEISEAGQGIRLDVDGVYICKLPFTKVYSKKDDESFALTHPSYNRVGLVVELPAEARDLIGLRYDKSNVDMNTPFMQALCLGLREHVNIERFRNHAAVKDANEMRKKFMLQNDVAIGSGKCTYFTDVAVTGGRGKVDLYYVNSETNRGTLVKFVANKKRGPLFSDYTELLFNAAAMREEGKVVSDLRIISLCPNESLEAAIGANVIIPMNKNTKTAYEFPCLVQTAADFGWEFK